MSIHQVGMTQRARHAHRPMSPQVLGSIVVTLVWSLGVLSLAHAQTDPVTADATRLKGFHSNRSYFSPEPFEHYDPVSGNLILSFTDLVLPGNAGRALQFQRTFNNQVTVLTSGEQIQRWSFGFPGMVMRVIERPIPTSPVPDLPVDVMQSTTPLLVMADGSIHRTMYTENGDARDVYQVTTARFFRYDRGTRTLTMPDGTVCGYDVNGYLRSFTDPFGNLVELQYGPEGWSLGATDVLVTQHVGNGERRDVSFQLDPASGLPTTMTHDGREWTYTYEAPYASPYGTQQQLAAVTGPEGLGWTFAYGNSAEGGNGLVQLTTPQGGVVTYGYEHWWFYYGPNPEDRVGYTGLSRRSTSGRGVEPATWTITPGLHPSQAYFIQSEIRTPSGTTAVYVHGSPPNPSPTVLVEGGVALTLLQVKDDAGTIVESEATTYQPVPVLAYASPTVTWVTHEPLRRTITRAGRAYVTEFGYSASNFGDYHHPTLLTETGELSRTTTRSYRHLLGPYILGLPASETVTETDAVERSWIYEDATGFRTSETRYGITTTFARDAVGNVGTVTKANGKATSLAYSWGQVSQTTTPEHVVTRTITPRDGTVASETRAGRTTTYTYDDLSRLTQTQPPGGSGLVNPIDMDYAGFANGVIHTTRGASRITTTLDGFGRPTGTANSLGVETRTAYDPEGRVVYQGSPFQTPAYPDKGMDVAYDVLGRVTTRTHPDGTFSLRTYGPGTVTLLDENGRTTVQTWRAFGHPDDARLTHLLDADGQGWGYWYNALGVLTRVVAPDGTHLREWVYDGDRLLSETHPESGTTTYAYDPAGVVTQKRDANGTMFAYTSDGNDRVRTITAGGQVTAITYEPGSDNRQTASVGGVASTLLWDAVGRAAGRTDVIDGIAFNTRYEYDANDHLTGLFYPALGATTRRRVGYQYDTEHRLSRVFDLQASRDYASAFQYHPSGALTEYTAGNTVRSLFTYDAQRDWMRSVSVGSHWHLQYQSYDPVGNVQALVDSRPDMDQTFTYDALDRLTGATGTGTYPPPSGWAYDAQGNRLDANGSTYTYEPGTFRLQTQNGEPFTYDSNGNLLTGTSKTFTYTPQNMLATSSVSGASSSYAYDADDWRVKKTTGATTTYYFRGLNGELLTEWKNPGPSGETRDYVYAGSRLVGVIGRPWDESPTDIFLTIVPNGPPVTVAFTTPGQRAWVTFEGIAGRRYAVWAERLASNGCPFYPLRLIAPDGQTLGPSVKACGQTFLEPVAAPVSGTYTLLVDPYGSEMGTVRLTLYDVPDDILGTIELDGPVVQVTLTPGQKARLTFNGTAGQRVSGVGSFLPGTGNTYFKVLKPDGGVLSSGSNVHGTWFEEPVTLPVTGTYTLLIDPLWASAGAGTARLYDIVDVTGFATIGGSSAPVPITKPGQNGTVTFFGTTGQRVSVLGALSSTNFELVLRRPDGTTVASASQFGTVLIGPSCCQSQVHIVSSWTCSPAPRVLLR